MKNLIVLLALIFSTAAAGQTIESMYWMTEQYPPYNYLDEKDGQLKGITVDILMEMFKKVGVKKTRKDLEILPFDLIMASS